MRYPQKHGKIPHFVPPTTISTSSTTTPRNNALPTSRYPSYLNPRTDSKHIKPQPSQSPTRHSPIGTQPRKTPSSHPSNKPQCINIQVYLISYLTNRLTTTQLCSERQGEEWVRCEKNGGWWIVDGIEEGIHLAINPSSLPTRKPSNSVSRQVTNHPSHSTSTSTIPLYLYLNRDHPTSIHPSLHPNPTPILNIQTQPQAPNHKSVHALKSTQTARIPTRYDNRKGQRVIYVI